MPFVLTIAQRKGGAGKSTLACQLAATFAEDPNLTVAGIDTDEQCSFGGWGALRAEYADVPPVPVIATSNYGLNGALRKLRDVDIIVIDTTPSVDAQVRQAIRAADLVLTPLQLSPFDLKAATPTAEFIGREGKPVKFVVNRTPPRARISDVIRAEIRNQNLPTAETELGNRAAYAESIANGLGVVEFAPASSPAVTEIRALAQELAPTSRKNRRAA
ncbi:MAG: ParA family protein [Pseudomonadota bacterium]